MHRFIRRLFGCKRHQAVYEEMQQLIGQIPTYTPNQKVTAVLIVQTEHLDSLPVSVIAIHDTFLSGIKMVEIEKL